jgi:YHS domain-containing protein
LGRLHFYNDHCEPCERLERNVFSQPKVAAAVERNYIPVKVHAGKQPRVAEHYRVERWPTDVICTAAGLEVYRTVSLQSADQFAAMCDGVALQAGVGASRQWETSMQAAGQQVFDRSAAQAQQAANQLTGTAQEAVSQAGAYGQGYIAQANTTAQGYAQQTDQQIDQAAQQLNQTAQQTAQGAEQARATTQDWTRRLGDTTSQLGNAGQQFGQAAQNTARDLRTTWDPTSLRTQSPYGGAPPTGAATVGTSGGSIYQPYEQQAAEPALPTSNPWIGQQPGPANSTAQTPARSVDRQGAPAVDPAAVAAAIATIQGNPSSQPSWQSAGSAGAPNSTTASSSATPSERANAQFVPASQAPALALEGYCPVTLLESRKWHKSDPQFGAIHRGRTYLFRTAAEQTKFLAAPDRYSPVLSGFDPVVFAQRGEQVAGKRSYGLTYNRQIYLFADEASLKAFEQSPQAYATAAHTAMMQAESAPQYR